MRLLLKAIKIFACLSLMISALGIGAAWDIAPAAQLETRLEDNVRMSTDDEDSALVTTATGQIKLRKVTETSEVSATAGLSFLTYANVNDLDDQDIQFLDISASHRGQRLRLGFAASYRRDVMLRRSRLIPDFGDTFLDTDIINNEDDLAELNADPDLDDSTTRLQVRRERIRIRPSLNWKLTERTNTRLTFNYSELNYGQGAQLVNLQDNKNQIVALSFRRRITSQDELALTSSARFFKPDQNPDSQNYELRATWNRQYSERSRIGIQFGVRRTERDSGLTQPSSSDTGFLFRINGNRNYERTRIRASAERSIYPSSFGQLVETDRLTLDVEHTLSARMAISLAARAFSTETDSDTGAIGRGDQDYLQIGPSVSYRISPAFTTRLSYEYTWIDRKQTNLADFGSASGNSISLAISYSPPRPI